MLPSSTAAAEFGDQFLRDGAHLGLVVPSVVMPEACNIALNPLHLAFSAMAFQVVPFIQVRFPPALMAIPCCRSRLSLWARHVIPHLSGQRPGQSPS
ncbi:RES domain-containing protein [Steroidobacter denitrificans]|uniref:RES domain-containing protein n=1 Tax=Steroidobacter denitrificans TaxID=465721 RepID=UPI00389AA21A